MFGFCSNERAGAAVQSVTVATIDAHQRSSAKTRHNFVCWNIDASRNREFFDRDLSVQKPFGAMLASYAKAISDAQGFSVLRFQGLAEPMARWERSLGSPSVGSC